MSDFAERVILHGKAVWWARYYGVVVDVLAVIGESALITYHGVKDAIVVNVSELTV